MLAHRYGSDGFYSALPVELGMAHHAMSLRIYMFRANLFFHFLEVICLHSMKAGAQLFTIAFIPDFAVVQEVHVNSLFFVS